MAGDRKSLKPMEGAARPVRQALGLRGELTLAVMPTLTALAALWVVAVFGHQRLLFASLASSAFLIYLDPFHGANAVRTLVLAQLMAAVAGLAAALALGHGYPAAGAAMVAAITLGILLDAVHPPAVGTALTFAFRPETDSQFPLFALALGVTVVLVGLERATLVLLAWLTRR